MKSINLSFLFVITIFVIQIINIKSNKIFDYSHKEGSRLNIHAGTLSSKRGIIPYAYPKLNICNSKRIKRVEDTLGEILTGNSYYSTEYLAKVNIDTYCNILCYNNFN